MAVAILLVLLGAQTIMERTERRGAPAARGAVTVVVHTRRGWGQTSIIGVPMAVVQVVGRRRCIGGMAAAIESKSICASTTSSTTGAAVDHNAAGQNSGSLDARLLGRSGRHSQRAGKDGRAHGTHHRRFTPARPNVPARRSTRSRTRNEALMMSSTGSVPAVDRRWFVGIGLVRKRRHGRNSAKSSGGSNHLLVRITTRIAAGGIGGGGGWEQKILAAGGHDGRFLLLGGGGGSAHHFPLPG